MKKKVFSLMMTLLLAFMGVAKADVVTIGEGTSTTYYCPFNSLYGYSFVEEIYTAAEVGMAGNITSISFDLSQSYTSAQTNNVVLYMKNVSRTSFSSGSDWETVTTGDIVYQGTWTIPANYTGWMTINLDTPFAYDGTSNLMIAMHESTSGYSTRYVHYTSTSNAVFTAHSDSYNPNPYDLGSYSGTKTTNGNRANIQLEITPAGGAVVDKLHVKYMDGADEIVDSLNLGVRPAGAWMEPFEFVMYSDGPTYTVNILDFTPSDGMFSVAGEELPFQVRPEHDVDLLMSTNGTMAGIIERQFVAITEGTRAAHIWPVVVELYAPETPDVWELACEEATTFPFVEVPATAHNTTLHNDYTLPFPEIAEGYDAVYKLVFTSDKIVNAEVTYGNDGKVALYTEDFNGEGGPMATNYYEGLGGASGGASGAPFEAQIGDGTNTSGYFPFYTLYNYSISENLFLASELTEAGVTSAPMTSLSWYATNAPGYEQQGITIWMANVDDESLTTTSHVTTGMTKVYTGAMTPAIGWNEFVFNEGSFSWDGHSNVLIYCQRNNGAWNSTVYWQGTSSLPFTCMAYRYQDSGAYDPTIGNTMYTSTTRPNIIMKGGNREGGNRSTTLNVSAGPVITDLGVRPGTYYLVASSTDPDFEVTINAEDMPCPAIDAEDFVFGPTPADNEDGIEPASVTLHWNIPEYATGWRLIFGSTYYPEPNHDQTIMYPEDGSFTNQMANSYTVRNLWNNTNYFWHVEFNNDGCPAGVSSPVWGFTTHLNIPQNLTAEDETVFNDETITLNWNAVVDRTYRFYNVYRDGVLIGNTQVNNIGATTYTDGPLAYNMAGYTYYVTAVYDEGESAPSNTVNVKVSGYGDVNGHVYEQDGTTGIAGATVTMVGHDEFGDPHTYNFTTNGEGYYNGHIYAGSYNGSAACNGYQGINAPVQGNPIAINYDQTTSPIDYMMDENFTPVCQVIAEYYPDSLDPASPYVKVYWGCGLPGNDIIEDFETGDFSQFEWQVSGSYPWSITTNNPYEGTYCMVSGGAGVANVVSDMSVTVDIPADGVMSFFGKISCESSWDYGYFYIDGVQKGSYTGAGNWAERTFDITAGEHTFKWSYTKDSSVNSNDDCFYVDYITFYRQPEPAVPGMTYTFEDGTMQGWTSVDADGDGYGWYMGSEIMTGQTGNGGSSDFVLSQSYYLGTVLYPDNYLVSPQVQLGGIVRFYACAQDNMYAAEHFGVAVSTTNTQPSSFTTIQEWTMTAKSVGEPNGKPVKGSRSGREQGNWYEYTVDLSAYSGMGYVAIRHFNCSDMFYLNVDDITIGEPGKGIAENRSLHHYRVYRTNCYNDGPYEEPTTVLLASVWVPDTVYIDVEWADLEPGVYKWGVGAVYSGNRGEETESPIVWSEPVNVNPDMATRQTVEIGDGTSTTYYGPYNSLWGYSFVEQVYTAAEIGTAGAINAISFNLRESDQPQTNQIDVFMKNVTRTNFASNADWEPVTASDMVFSGTVTFSPGWSTITLDSPFQYDGTSNLMIGIHEYTSGYSTRYFYYTSTPNALISAHSDTSNPDPYNIGAFTGTKYVQNYRNNIQIDITPGGGGGGQGGNAFGPGGEPIQLERESVIVWSNCLDKDMYLDNVDVTVLLNSADSPEGTVVTLTNLNEYEQGEYPVAPVTLDGTGYYAWDTFRRGNYAVKVELEGYEPIEDTVSIWDETHLRYVMTEILYGIDEIYVSRTGWAMWSDSHNGAVIPGGGTPGGGGQGGGTGDTFSVNFDDGQLPAGWTTIDANNDGYNWVLGSQIGGIYLVAGASLAGSGHNSSNDLICSGSYSNATSTAITPDNYLVSPQVNLAAGSTFSFWACAQDAGYPAEHFGVFVSDNGTSNWTEVQSWTMTAKNGGNGMMSIGRDGNNRAQGSWYNYSVDLSNYAGQKYVAIRHFNCNDQFILDVDDIELTAGAKSGDRHLEAFKVMCTSIDGEPIYNANVPASQPFCQLATEELVPGDHYICKVAAIYSTGMSDWVEQEWQYLPCENYAGTVSGVTVEGNEISWEYPGTPGPGPQPGQGDTFTESWDNGLNGWTNIDNDGDGHMWYHSTEAGNHSTMAVDSHSGAGHLMGESYCNATWAALTPDDYIVSPQQYAITNGSTISIWACTQDVSYPSEHFGFAISTGSNTNASDFTTVAEWTITAKGAGKGIVGRDGRASREGNWYQFSADLSNYAGQNVWIAVRHFNCTDMFILNIDDIELSIAGKGRAMWDFLGSFTGTSAGQQGIATDGNFIYTCSWQASPAGGYTFYQYTMDGTFVEGFNISGVTELRDLTYDGQYFYAGKGSSVLYCIDLANRTLIGQTSTTCSAIRHCSYDPVNDGFWVGNWSDLKLVDRSGATLTNGPALESAYGSAYYDNHLYLFTQPNSDARVYDYDILANTLSSTPVFSFTGNLSGCTGIAGGAFIGQYGNKIAFFGNVQQDPNLIGIYEIADGAPAPGPTPSTGDVLGAMIFVDGEWEAFVEYPTNNYVYEGEGNEVCVRMVYNGTNNLPEGNIYFSMSCPECEEIVPGFISCEAGAPIHGEQVDPEHIKVWWGEEPAAPISEWLYYDNGTYATSVGTNNASATIYWATMFPAASLAPYAGTNLTKVAVFEFTSNANPVTVTIHLGGTTAPGTAYSTTTFVPSVDEDFEEVTVDPVAIDGTQNLWIVCAQMGTHPAHACTDTGDPNNRWISLDGTAWQDLAAAGLPGYGWLLRGFVTNQGKGSVENIAIELPAPAAPATNTGVLSHTEVVSIPAPMAFMNRANLVKYNVYRSTEPEGDYTLIGEVAETGADYYEYIDEPGMAGTFYYQVRAYYDNDCESEPALAADDPTHNYVTGTAEGIGENSDNVALYPNPTNGNVTIEAQGMSRITVVSVLGQVVFDTELSADNYTLNMAQFNAGMYMVRVYTESGVTVKRVTVMQ